jgi:hypothetical protein
MDTRFSMDCVFVDPEFQSMDPQFQESSHQRRIPNGEVLGILSNEIRAFKSFLDPLLCLT